MKKKEVENALVARLLTVFGAPDRTDDVAGFLDEYRTLLAGFGPNVLKMAGDHLIRNGGKYWPSPKVCVDACVDAQETMAGRAAASEAGKPKTKLPWEIHTERAHEWATKYVETTDLGRRAQSEGWARELRLYAMSYAKNGYGAGLELMPMDKWKPKDDVILNYRAGFLRREQGSAA